MKTKDHISLGNMTKHQVPYIGLSIRKVRALTPRSGINLPRFAPIKVHFSTQRVRDFDTTLAEAITQHSTLIKPGSNIALAIGSRGIARLPELVRRLAEVVRQSGALPFIVPAMGSHGGATPMGQERLLSGLGITPEAVGAPIRSSMDVEYLGRTPEGVPVYIDRLAFHSDGIIVMNRVREHTDFEGPIQSGLMKMLSVGLGKALGASAIHAAGAAFMPVNILSVANWIIAKAPVLFGIGIVENGEGELAAIRCATPEHFELLDRELLILAKKLTPRLPIRALDVLVVRYIGKDISGTGMDTKTIGRIRIPGVPEPEKPSIQRIAALDLTNESQGNATGLALADVITQRLFSKINFDSFYLNQLAAAHFEGGKIPIVMATDKDALQAVMCLGWNITPKKLRAMIIKDTKHVSDILISEALVTELSSHGQVTVTNKLTDLNFSLDGSLLDRDHPNIPNIKDLK